MLETILYITISFLFSPLIHYAYRWTKWKWMRLISPVNESFVEHLKLITTMMLIFAIVTGRPLEYAILGCTTSIFLAILFYSFGLHKNHNFKITIILFLISIILSGIIKHIIDLPNNLIIGVISMILIHTLTIIFTFKPLKKEPFLCSLSKVYGIGKD